MPVAGYLVAALCLLVAAVSLYILARTGWVRTTRATILALVILLVLAYWEGSRAADMRGLAMIATGTLMILPALVGGLAGTWLGQRHRKTEDDR